MGSLVKLLAREGFDVIKTLIISAYVIHKIYWKRTNKEVSIKWAKFFV